MYKKIFIWDDFSDQFHIIKDKKFKKKVRLKHSYEYIKMFFTSIFMMPFCFFTMFFLKGKQNTKNFYGIGVNLDKTEFQQELIEELGVKNLIIRMPLWDIKNIKKYYDFANSFNVKSKKNILINILQDRQNIENKQLLEKNLFLIFQTFSPLCDEFQIANAINRLKWGFFSTKEYFEFFQTAQKIKNKHFLHVKLIAPSVIDFEFHYTTRALYNFHNINFDIVSSLLYVDRRGDPSNKQYLFFDTKNKINLLYSLVKFSPKCKNDIYITEVNYPLKGTAPYAPTSEKECVSDDEYTKYMLKYFQIAKKTKKIKRIYWHQLVANGYGLVKYENGKIIKKPQFYAFKKMIDENIY